MRVLTTGIYSPNVMEQATVPPNATMAVVRAGHFGIVAVGILLFTELQALCVCG